MLQIIDNFLNKITMYRLVLYFLTFLIIVSIVFSFFKILPFNPIFILLSIVIILGTCYTTNLLFSKIFSAPTNTESAYITAMILILIVSPPQSFTDISYFIFMLVVATLAMASKYILAIGKKHLFNPAAVALVATAFTLNHSANWWVGNSTMAAFLLLGGLLVARKLRKFDLVFGFAIIALVLSPAIHTQNFTELPKVIWSLFLNSPILFFAFIMLTEPQTTPPTKYGRIAYGVLVGILFDPTIHFGNIFSTPEIALVLGNVFSYIVSPKQKLLLQLKEKIKIARDTYQFSFDTLGKQLKFNPGQYLEWTLAHPKPDTRGNRRYFTISSAPTDNDLKIGVKFYPNSSSFKNALFNMHKGEVVVASQLSGEFTLPANKDLKLCFLAGGIGITPFESMLQYLIEKKEKRDIVVFYSNKTFTDVAYMDTLKRAEQELGIRTIYAFSEQENIPTGWPAEKGFITSEMIKNKMPDYKDRIYYISGPHGMVSAFEDMLSKIEIPRSNIKIDFFPGYA